MEILMNEIKEKVNEFLKRFWAVLMGIVGTLMVQQIITYGKVAALSTFGLNTYKKMGEDVHDSPYLYALLATITFTSIVIFLIDAYKKSKQNNIISATLNIIFVLFMIFMSYFFIIRTNSIMTANYNLKNVEIIRPYISENKYIKIKSDMYQIKSKKDFEKFDKYIRSVANKNDCNIY